MEIRIRGACEHNLKNVDVQFADELTVVTGVSGSGKTSLVFDTLHHEAHRRFLDVFLYGRSGKRLAPAKVEAITGLVPTIAVGQNLLNRNPLSTLASASGLHPFFRLLYSNYGVRHCRRCSSPLSVLTEDEILDRLVSLSKQENLNLSVTLLHQVKGSHTTLLKVLKEQFGKERLIVDGEIWDAKPLDPMKAHDVEIEIKRIDKSMSAKKIREFIQRATALGAGVIRARGKNELTLASTPVCNICGAGFRELRPTHFNQSCPYCEGEGCERCDQTGMHPQAASVRWEGMRLPELLALSVGEVRQVFSKVELPSTANRLCSEIQRRLDALEQVGLGYISLDRSAPSLSRGESQRVRLAISLSSRLEDMLHVLDEPTIGQHPADVARLLPAFRDLAGPVIYVEHDRVAAAEADQAIDLGPGAGKEGGNVIFSGPPAELWKSGTATGRYFSLRDRVMTLEPRPPPDQFLLVRGAHQHNLKHIDLELPIGRLTVITGVSGSGKSTLVEHVLVPSLTKKKPIGCKGIQGPSIKPVMVDQSPIGKNPRSNPATYTKLSDIIRDLYAEATGLSKSHFSFNRPEGACPTCKGIGATEIKMRYLPSLWIPCADCDGQRFNEEVLAATVEFGNERLSIADFYSLSIQEVRDLIQKSQRLPPSRREAAHRILQALSDVGLGYLELGQPSPTLSGGEAQRVKLAKYLGRNKLSNQLIVLDEPSTGLHPKDLNGLLRVLDRLVRNGATIVVVEHNTDIIRAADWIIDLGPGAGPKGGELLYAGPLAGLDDVRESVTGKALKDEKAVQPRKPSRVITENQATPFISIRNARANNLKGVDVDIPKGTLTIVTGVSGSGKSSLIQDVLQTEARRRYLESLSMFERQGVRESAEAPVDAITGLGVTLTVAPHRAHLWSHIPQFTRRNSVGAISELSFHVANLLASLGERRCLKCGAKMKRQKMWVCPKCNATAPIAKARHFSGAHFASSCGKCGGLGSFQAPQPEKLIIHPERPLCAGGMWSPGYWPRTYLCKDQPIIPALGERYGFDPFKTPWDEMSKEAQNAFLFGDDETYSITYRSKSPGPMKGKPRTHTWKWRGFYGKDSWLWDWDIHGTYTETVVCPECNGKGLLPQFLAVTLQGHDMYELSEMPLNELEELLKAIPNPPSETPLAETSLNIALRRLRFLRQVGVGYLHLNRPTGTLSAGEAQRIQLASLLGSELTSLTILIDEPSRGMHPSELEALREALHELRDEGNTVIVVEHDLLLIRAADHVIDLGPGAGASGGEIVAEGKPDEIVKANSVTGKWLQDDTPALTPQRRSLQDWIWPNQRRRPQGWMEIKGARAHNLRGEDVQLPLGTLIGVCGLSGSGKSTLVIDTLGRALVKKSYSSSFAREPVEPGEHDSIENAPKRAFIVDQSRRGIRSPAVFLGLIKPVQKIYADCDDAQALGLDEQALSKRCSACNGHGRIRIDMGFLPNEYVECETCNGTGYWPEAWEVRFKGVALPEIDAMTLDEVYELFKDEERIAKPLDVARRVGLGYLVWNQPAYTLSSGEVQRLEIAKELYKKTKSQTLYILDEPTVGLHMEDVARLVEVLNQLVDAGHTVVVVEHHPHLLANCDWLIELGPGGGPDGGKVIAEGPPSEVAKKDTPTAPYLREVQEARP